MSQKKIKVLFIAINHFEPENLDGVNKINFNIVKDNKYYDVEFYSLNRIAEESQVQKIKKRSKLSSLFSPDPFNVYSISELKKLSNFLNDKIKEFDVVHISSLAFAHLAKLLKDQDKIFFSSIDCLTLLMKRKYKSQRNPLIRFLYYLEFLKSKKLESNLYDLVESAHFVSGVDGAYAKDNLKLKTPIIIPNGINLSDFYEKSVSNNHEEYRITFTGNFNYFPNVESANFIIDEIAPYFLNKDYKVSFYLVGANPTEKMSHCRLNNIKVTGRVESMGKYLRSSSLFICPIFSGSGIKNKLLEAMSTGIHSICSTLSLDGIEMPINYTEIKSSNASEWITSIERHIKQNDHEATHVKEFQKFYNWSNIIEKYYQNYLKNKSLL